MQTLTNYLIFDGNCAEAMTYYSKCFEAELQLIPFSKELCNGATEVPVDRIMHANLKKGSPVGFLMASDNMPGMPFLVGNNFSISVACDSVSEIDKLYEALGENGKTTMPLQKTFWAARFGMLTDKFGINWMLIFGPAEVG